MNAKIVSFFSTQGSLLARSVFAVIGCFAIYWGLTQLPVSVGETAAERIASRILAGDSIKAEGLSRQLLILEDIAKSPNCRPAALRSEAIFRIRAMEVFVSTGQGDVDERVNLMADSVRRSLHCSPADPFLWLVLYWVENRRNVSSADDLRYLRMSYQLGPHEGWIGVKRNRLAFARSELPPDLAEIVLREFVELVQSGFYEESAQNFVSLTANQKALVLESLKYIPETYRKQFFWVLRDVGYDDQQLLSKDSRPWQ